MKKIFLISMVAALLIGAFTITAQGYQGRGPGGRNGRFKNRLNLSFEQQQKLLEIRQDFAKETLTLRFDLQKKRLELRQLKAADPVNQEAVDAKTKDIQKLQDQLQTKAKAMREKMKAVLTADQLKQLNSKQKP
ncbi:MAG: Spy/CpxP family protein refolding chaperone [Bacillota bacterium]